MKLLTGGNLAEAQSRLAHDFRAISQLVIEIASAVHHAHQRGVLHRDLKPANILLDDEGHPRVTDFGLAKRAAVHAGLTRVGAVLGSPGYMAPEQAMGDQAKVSTATDVYGLGAILYSLLTGRAPFEGISAEQTIYRLCNDLPEPPRSLDRAVPRPLEVICLKCLEKDPARRYSSAAAVADDLGCWQAGEPILARPVATPVRAWLWVRRHPSQAVLAGALLCSLIAGFAGMFSLWRQAERNIKDLNVANAALKMTQQREQSALARAQDGFALCLEALLNVYAGETREDLLLQIPRAKRLRIEQLGGAVAVHKRLETFLKGESSPNLLARFAESYAKLGAMATEVGWADTALSAYQRAVEIRRDLISHDPADYQKCLDLAEVLERRARVERKFDHHADALESLRERAAIFDELVRDRPGDEKLLNKQMWSLANLAAQLRTQDRPLEALQLHEQVLRQRQELVRRFPNDFKHRAEWAFCMAEVGLLQSTIPERLVDGVASLEKARDELESIHHRQPGHESTAWWLTQCLHGLSKAYKSSGATKSSLDADERASVVVGELVTSYPKLAKYRERQARINSELSNSQSSLGEPARAAQGQAVASLVYLVRAYPGSDRNRADLVLALLRQTALARDAGELALAETSARQSVEHAEQLATSAKGDANIARAADCHLHLAAVLLDRGRRAGAEAQIGAAVASSARLKQPDPKVIYDLARVRAMLDGIATTGSERDAMAGAAMVALRRSMDSGYRDVFDTPNEQDRTALRPGGTFSSYSTIGISRPTRSRTDSQSRCRDRSDSRPPFEAGDFSRHCPPGSITWK